MKNLTSLTCLLFAFAAVPACSDDDDVSPPPPVDATADRAADSAAAGDGADATTHADAHDADAHDADASVSTNEGDASATSEAASDATLDGAAEATPDGAAFNEAAADAVSDGTTREAGPGGDGGLVLGGGGDGGGEAGTSTATFRLLTPVNTNLLSLSDLRPVCLITTSAPGNHLLTCEERNAPNGPCRTLEVAFRINSLSGPRSGDRYPTVMKSEPAVGEAVARYRESINCAAATTNGWVQAQPGGDLTVDLGADTSMTFTLHDVSMGPAPAGPLNQNAQGTFTLAGSGTGTGLF